MKKKATGPQYGDGQDLTIQAILHHSKSVTTVARYHRARNHQ